jgi:hypothetical protein
MLEIPESDSAYLDFIGAKPRNMIRKAERAGYEFRRFDYNERLDEVFAVNTSKPVRAGGPLLARLEQRPSPIRDDRELCDVHGSAFFGAFRDDVLLAYIELVQVNELGIFNRILGHADALPDGVMNGLVRYVVSRCIDESAVRSLNYLTLVASAEGLVRFKLNVGFRSRAVALRVGQRLPSPASR